jgi:hypothetical protein
VGAERQSNIILAKPEVADPAQPRAAHVWADGRAGYLLDEELGEELSGSASRHG